MNLASLLWFTGSKYPRRIALVDEGKRWDYAALLERVKSLAAGMLQRGIRPGDQVAIMLPNCHEFVEAYFATLALGAVATPVNFRFLAQEIRFVLEDSEARALFFHSSYPKRVAEALEGLPGPDVLVRVEKEAEGPGEEFERLLSDVSNIETPFPTREEDPCQLMYTSGTTGAPKGALIPHRAVLWNLINTMYGREDREGEKALIIGPMYHTAALNNHLTIQMALGGTAILIRSFEPELVLRVIQEEKATTISGAPPCFTCSWSIPMPTSTIEAPLPNAPQEPPSFPKRPAGGLRPFSLGSRASMMCTAARKQLPPSASSEIRNPERNLVLWAGPCHLWRSGSWMSRTGKWLPGKWGSWYAGAPT